MSREDRKLDHIRLALATAKEEASDFDDLHIVHRSIPGTALENCRLDTQIGGLDLSSPIFINAMTGGAFSTMEINRQLAEVARETGVALAVGSQRAALTNPELIETYRIVRTINPKGIIIGNLGADTDPDDAQRAVEMIEANMLQLHLNVPQELVMPEGDRDFTSILKSIERVVQQLPIPVIVKEVGFGMSAETYRQLSSVGVSTIDVGGHGGTNFIKVENQRRKAKEYNFLSGWGQSTAISLLELQLIDFPFEVVASGGIRNSLDMVKSLVLGAEAVGIAGGILRVVTELGISGAVDTIYHWHEQMKTIMTMMGVQTIKELQQVPVVISGFCKDWCQARGIETERFARRKSHYKQM